MPGLTVVPDLHNKSVAKACARCGIVQPVQNFHRNGEHASSWCKACRAERLQRLSPLTRVLNKISIGHEHGCWEWLGAKQGGGYGTLAFGPRSAPVAWLAHRYTYEHFIGGVPKGLQLDHLCRNRGCVNPWHLEPVTGLENVNRGLKAKGTHRVTRCPRGHPYSGDNLYINPVGAFECRICKRESVRRARERKAVS